MNLPSICVSIGEPTSEAMLRSAAKAKKLGAELVELRLDYLEHPEEVLQAVRTVGDKVNIPIIATLRPEWEGGLFKATERKRQMLLENLIHSCFNEIDYIDLEVNIAPSSALRKLVCGAHEKGIKVIISFHDHGHNPAAYNALHKIQAIFDKCMNAGADIIKIVFKTNNPEDVRALFRMGECANAQGARFIILGTGTYGESLRVHAPTIGSEMVYAALEKGKETAEGQLDIHTLRRAWRSLGYYSKGQISSSAEVTK